MVTQGRGASGCWGGPKRWSAPRDSGIRGEGGGGRGGKEKGEGGSRGDGENREEGIRQENWEREEKGLPTMGQGV